MTAGGLQLDTITVHLPVPGLHVADTFGEPMQSPYVHASAGVVCCAQSHGSPLVGCVAGHGALVSPDLIHVPPLQKKVLVEAHTPYGPQLCELLHGDPTAGAVVGHVGAGGLHDPWVTCHLPFTHVAEGTSQPFVPQWHSLGDGAAHGEPSFGAALGHC